jgi:hypothetical protein
VSPPTVLVITISPGDLRDLVRDALRVALAENAPSPSMTVLVDRRELARLLGVSTATVTRLTVEGMPCTHVGDSPRHDVEAVRTWLVERGRRGTKAAPSKGETVSGVRLLSRAAR